MATQNAAAAPMTTSWVPAAADAVSAFTAAQFSAQAALYQAVSSQGVAAQELFVETPGATAGSYAAAEAANALTTS